MKARIKIEAIPPLPVHDRPKYIYFLYNMKQKITKPILVILGTLTIIHHK